MSLMGILLNPVRSVLSSSIKAVFEPDVRNNPIIIDANTQSDDNVKRKFNHSSTSSRIEKEKLYGFTPQYVVLLRKPKTDVEAQRLYNHIRTISWYLDAIPLLGRNLPFNIGIDSIIGIIPGVGDYIGFLLSLYALFLSALFGLPINVLGMMLLNIFIDTVIGLVPIIGDALDVAFKANLRNLRLLEDHLVATKGSCSAGNFNLVFPPSNTFLPADSPQRYRNMPNLSEANYAVNLGQGQSSQRTGWASTSSARAAATSTSSRQSLGQDFGKGAMKKVDQDDGAMSSFSTTIVPNEIFTTMRYEEDGISLEDMCTALAQRPVEIGSLSWKEKKQIPLLDRHLSRLQTSVRAMRIRYPLHWGRCEVPSRIVMQQAIASEVTSDTESKGTSRRVRASIDQNGLMKVTSFIIIAASKKDNILQSVRLDIHTANIISEEEMDLYRYKTGFRDMHDSARARVNATLGIVPDKTNANNGRSSCFDVLLLTTLDQGQVVITESSIANVLLLDHQNGRIFTPTVTSNRPILPGLMRQELLSMAVIEEKDLLVDKVKADLQVGRATLYLCNALRGIIPISLIE